MSTTREPRISLADQQGGRSTKSLEKATVQRKQIEKAEKENFKEILGRIYKKESEHQDYKDINLQPSYTKFELPYTIKCRSRYYAKKKFYEQNFQYEIEQLIAHQATGYEAARLNRHMCITTIWPPLHSRCEIDHTQRYFFSLTSKECQRLNLIMSTNVI